MTRFEDEDFDVIDSLEVQSMIKDYLHKTMAYSVVVMDEDIANSWARSFVRVPAGALFRFGYLARLLRLLLQGHLLGARVLRAAGPLAGR